MTLTHHAKYILVRYGRVQLNANAVRRMRKTMRNRWQVIYRDVLGGVLQTSPHWFRFTAVSEVRSMERQSKLMLLRNGIPQMFTMSIEPISANVEES